MAAACANPIKSSTACPRTCGRDRPPATIGIDVLAEGEHLGAAGYHITLGEPRHVNVTGENAYVVVPATMTFDLKGKQVTQTGALFTVALRKLDTQWRLSAWAWAKGT